MDRTASCGTGMVAVTIRKFPFAAPTPPGASDAAGVEADVDEASAPPVAAFAEAGASPGDASAAGLGSFDHRRKEG